MCRVSVILPNFNHARYLNERVDSILNQTFQDFELLILDDCSSDESRAVIESYKDNPHVTHIIYNEVNSGSTFKQWDKGIALAQGEWIWIAESDDVADPRFLEVMISNVDKSASCCLAFCKSRLIDANGCVTFANDTAVTETARTYPGHCFIKERLSLHNDIWNASMMIFKKACFPESESRKLYESMRYCGDWMFYVLIAEKADVVEVPVVLNSFRQHKNNVSSGAEKAGLAWIEGLEVFSRIKRQVPGKLRLNMVWAKNICRSHRRNTFSPETLKRIEQKLRDTSTGALLFYYLFKPFY